MIKHDHGDVCHVELINVFLISDHEPHPQYTLLLTSIIVQKSQLHFEITPLLHSIIQDYTLHHENLLHIHTLKYELTHLNSIDILL